MSTDHQRRMGYRERMRHCKSLGEAQALLEMARKNLPAEAFKKVKSVFDRLSFAAKEI